MLTNGVFSDLMLIWENSQEGNKNSDRNCKMYFSLFVGHIIQEDLN
jgi:hypothetical protein